MRYTVCFLIISLFSLYNCTSKNVETYFVSDSIADSIKIERFDMDLNSFLKGTSSEKEDDLKSKYKDFLAAFGSITIDNPDYENPLFFAQLLKYFSNDMLQQIYKDAVVEFSNVEPYKQQLGVANKLIGENFKDKKLPKLAMHVSGFKANTIVTEDFISISSDKYLGKDYSVYQDFFEPYQRIQMQPQMVARDYLKAWVIGEIPMNNKRKDLLSEMIYQGKILYALEKLLPDWGEADLIGYTQEQIDWATKNGKKIWKETVSKNHLYSTDHMTIKYYLDEAPYTLPISLESPGRLGEWIGWNIVKAYAENSKLTLEEILKETDNQNILKVSKYNGE